MGKTLKSKEFFKQIRAEQLEIWAMEQDYHGEYVSMMPSGIRYDLDKVQTSPKDSIPEHFAYLDSLSRELKQATDRLWARKAEALKLIGNLDEPYQRTIMELYYLTIGEGRRLKTWEDVASEIHWGLRTVLRIHGQALLELEKYMP